MTWRDRSAQAETGAVAAPASLKASSESVAAPGKGLERGMGYMT
jgi:hypothetical protein